MKTERRASGTELVVLLLFPGFSNLCLANAVEPLRAANTLARRPLYRWRFVAMGEGPLLSSSGLPVQPEMLDREARGDMLLVMPSYDHIALATPDTLRRLRGAAARFCLVAGLDSGSWLLAHAGLLNGYRATSHWDILSSLAERFPELDVVTDRFVIDRDRASCGGATATLDLMLYLIGQRHGTTLALDVAALFLYGGGAEHPAPHMPVLPQRTLREAAALMRRNLEEPWSIPAIAGRLGLSQRKLEALFRAHADLTPVQLYRRIRLGEARRRVLETTQSIAEIAGRCGYADPAAMTRAFRAEYGVTPRALRGGAGDVRQQDATDAERAILTGTSMEEGR
jgi:transcriptional regulator GlxA family with amidase domain